MSVEAEGREGKYNKTKTNQDSLIMIVFAEFERRTSAARNPFITIYRQSTHALLVYF